MFPVNKKQYRESGRIFLPPIKGGMRGVFFRFFTYDIDRAVMQFDQFFGQSQSDAAAFAVFFIGAVRLIKPVIFSFIMFTLNEIFFDSAREWND
jgi:hypothetical protein